MIPLAEFLTRLSAELGHLEVEGETLEHAVADLFSTQQAGAPAALQELDRLVQRLRDLAAVVMAAVPLVPAADLSSATLAGVTRLEQTRVAILGHLASPAEDDDLFFGLPDATSTTRDKGRAA